MKKSELRMMIREIVREEVAMSIQEVIKEIKEPSKIVENKVKKQSIRKKKYTKNSVLNEILNETALGEEWKTLGNGVHTTDKMNEVLGASYTDITNTSGEVNADKMVASMGVNPNSVDDSVKNIFTKDYRTLMKKIDEKKSVG